MSTVYEMIRQSMPHTVPFAKHTGIELTDVGEGHATATLAQTQETTNHIGSIHAGALFTLAETAAGGAVAGGFAPYMLNMKALPTDLSIQLTKPVKRHVTAQAVIVEELEDLHAVLNEHGEASFKALVRLQADEEEMPIGTFLSDWQVRLRKASQQAA